MKQVTVVGIGMGNHSTLTLEAMEVIQKAQVLLGAPRMVDAVKDLAPEAKEVRSYKSDEITSFIASSDFLEYVIVMSGDTGFHSGTKELRSALATIKITPNVLPGISSVSYFFAKVGLSWEDACLVSMHGRQVDVVKTVREHTKTFFLTGGNVNAILAELASAGLGHATCFVGENLSYETERVFTGTVASLLGGQYGSICVLLVVNEEADDKPSRPDVLTIGIPDEAFLRGKVPMTKSEVRAVILSKLKLRRGSVAYDVGAGTGSVSIEMALNIGDGMVYAIETNPEGVELIHQNKEAFGATQLTVVEGLAPNALEGLPCPSSVFIGGSKGNMEAIVKTILDKLPAAPRNDKDCGELEPSDIQFVVSAIALETMAETIAVFNKVGMEEVDIAQVQVSKSKKVGKYNMMMGQNPIYIISGRKGNRRES